MHHLLSECSLIFLLIGIYLILQNVSACLIPYLTEQIISVAGSVGSLIYIGYKFYSKPEDVNKFFSQFIFNDSESDDMKKIIYIAIVLVILLSIEGVYSWIVIFTLYKEISASGHKVQDTIILDNYPQNGNLSFNNNNNNNNFATNTNLSLGDYPPPLGLSMNPSSLNVGINSYPSNLHQNQGNNAPDALAFTYN